MRNVLVIGGAGGLGAAVVKQLLDEGFGVSVAGRATPADRRVRHSHVIDATRADWRALFARIEKESGTPIDAVVYVAGCGVFGRTSLVPANRARRMFELNFWALAAAATAAAESWSSAGRAGTFVAVLSIVARQAVPFEAHYAASKAAAARFLESLDLEYGGSGIRFVPAFPGMLKTPFRRDASWHGLPAAGVGQGADVRGTAHAIVELLKGRRKARVIGWRERGIDLAGRVLPDLYDRAVLRRRADRMVAAREDEGGARARRRHKDRTGSSR